MQKSQFIELWMQCERSVYRYLLTLMPDADAADDVLQETALALWEKAVEYQPELPFFAWACGFARNKALTYYRARSRLPQLLDEDVVELLAAEAAATADEEWFQGLLKALSGCVSRLQPPEQRLLQARYGEGEGGLADLAQELERQRVPEAELGAQTRLLLD
jgi:RNA polymerase sigma-70 factor, ECF subfamily